MLCGRASAKLGLIERINNTDEIDKYLQLKKTTGSFPGTYYLKIDPTVKPVVHGPRRQPGHLLPNTKAKLKEMK